MDDRCPSCGHRNGRHADSCDPNTEGSTAPMIHAEAFDLLMGNVDNEDDELEGLQQLIDSGMAWRLEGSVGRAAMRAIEDGVVALGRTGHRDYYGNYVPSRYEVQPGTKGSPEYAHKYGHNGIAHREGGRFAPCSFR